MRLSKSLIKNVVTEVAGEEGVVVSDYLMKKEFAEEDLAKKMKQELKHTRNILYKLQKHNLVEFQRKRNDANGWYTYYWSFNSQRVKDIAKKIALAKLERLNYRLNIEENTQFFSCKKKCMRVDFEGLMNFNYKCPECDGLMEQLNNKKKIKEIKAEIKEIKLRLKKK